MLTKEDLRSLIDDALIAEHLNRAMTPDRPVLRGTAQNPDAFFQARETINPFYAVCADITQKVMDDFAAQVGRHYNLFDYVGAPDAERVIVLMGSGCEAAQEGVEYLVRKGEKIGVVKVRLYRPFDGKRLVECLPATARSLAVLDRTKEPGAAGEPLYQDLREKIRASDVSHGHETSWRSDGVGHYVWFAGNEHLAFFHIDRHRSAEVAKSIFGEDFAGTLVRDRYAAYNGIGVDWQVCLAHLITNAKEIRGEHALLPRAEKDAAPNPFCNRLIDLLSRLCDTAEKLKSGEIPWKAVAKIEKHPVTELNNLCNQPLRFKPAEALRAFLTGPEQKFLFVRT